MTNYWTVQFADGPHSLSATMSPWTGHVKILYDGKPAATSLGLMHRGEVRRFEKGGHAFALSVRSHGFGRRFVLTIDGIEVASSGVPQQTVFATPGAVPAIQFVKELDSADGDEVLGIEEYPLDNSFGDAPLSTDRAVSKESTTDFSADFDQWVNGKAGGTLFSALSVEVAARVSRAIGYKIGETVTESHTLHFTVRERSAVRYQVIWKRKVRTGEQLYLADGDPVSVPYRVSYGLSCEVRTAAFKDDGSAGN